MAIMQFQEQENIPLNCFKRKIEEIEDRTTYGSRKVSGSSSKRLRFGAVNFHENAEKDGKSWDPLLTPPKKWCL